MLQGQYRATEKSGMVQQGLDTAYSRMQWVRQSILRTWDPDYQVDMQTGQRILDTQKIAPNYKPLVMDERWWFWNIVATVLAPTLGIILFCEWYGRPQLEAYESDRALLELQEMVEQGSLTQEQALEQHDLFCQERFGLPLWQQLETACRELYEFIVHGTIPASLDPNHHKNKGSNNTSLLFAGPSPMFLQREEEPNEAEKKNPQPAHLQQPPAPALVAATTTANQSQSDPSSTTSPSTSPKTLDSNQSLPTATAPPDDGDKNKDDALHLSPSLSVLLQRIQALEERLAHQEQRHQPLPAAPSSTTIAPTVGGSDPFADDDYSRSMSTSTTPQTTTPIVIPTTGGGQVEEQQQALEERDQWLLALAKAEQVKYRERKKKQLEQEQPDKEPSWMEELWKQGTNHVKTIFPDQTALSSILGSLSLSSSPMEEEGKTNQEDGRSNHTTTTTTTTVTTPPSTREALQPRNSSSSTHSTDKHHQKDDDTTKRLDNKDNKDENIDKLTTTTTTTPTKPVLNNKNTTDDPPHRRPWWKVW